MWMLFARAPRPEARHWPGRRMFALIDAVAWPGALAVSIFQLPVQVGTFGQVLLAMCGVAGARRAWRAAVVNQRYHFTTAWATRPLALLLAVAAVMRLAA
jgi:fucose permease